MYYILNVTLQIAIEEKSSIFCSQTGRERLKITLDSILEEIL